MAASKPIAISRESWIDRIVKSYNSTESPDRYFWWSSIAALAAVTRKNVFLNRGNIYRLYPNVYVALISKDTGLRKGTPISVAKRLVKSVNCTRVIEGRSSIQAVISDLSKVATLNGGRAFPEAHALLISDEFDTMFVKDPESFTLLTAWYNTHEHEEKWVNTLKGSGREEFKEPCISFLFASNEKLFYNAVTSKDVEGGFLARTHVIWEEVSPRINTLVRADPNAMTPDRFSELSKELKEISEIKGEFLWTEEAADVYEPWYQSLRTTKFNDKTGAVYRLGDTVLKVTMLLNLAGARDLRIRKDDLELAIEKCEECLGGVKKLTHSTGMSDQALAKRYVIKALLEAKEFALPRARLLRALDGEVDMKTLNAILEEMDESGTIQAFRDSKKLVCYQLTTVAIQMYTKNIQEMEGH